MTAPAPGRARAVLHNPVAGTAFWLHRFAPDPVLAPFVDVYWTVRWDLRGPCETVVSACGIWWMLVGVLVAVLVERMVKISQGLGREVATPKEARKILGLYKQ